MAGAVALFGTGACGSNPIYCLQDSPRPAMRVTLYDRTADTIIVGGVRGEVRDGGFRDSLYVLARNADWEPTGYGAANGRPGTYTLVVERDGFRSAERRGIVVPDRGACGVYTAQVRVDMERP